MEINLLEALIYSILPTVIATLITLYITEKIKGKVKSNFDEKLEKIRKDHNIEITRFQADLDQIKNKENYKFTKLHEKRFEILENLYSFLTFSLSELNAYLSPIKIVPYETTSNKFNDDLQAKFVTSHNEFVALFSKNKIYLNDKIISLIENYLSEISTVYSDYAENHNLRMMGEKPDVTTSMKAFRAYKLIPEKISPLKEEIENEFREILER